MAGEIQSTIARHALQLHAAAATIAIAQLMHIRGLTDWRILRDPSFCILIAAAGRKVARLTSSCTTTATIGMHSPCDPRAYTTQLPICICMCMVANDLKSGSSAAAAADELIILKSRLKHVPSRWLEFGSAEIDAQRSNGY